MDIGYQANTETRPSIHNANRRADSVPRGGNNLRIHMVTLHANPPLQLQFATRLEAEHFAEKQNLDANLCILHEDGRVLSFRRKGDKEFSVITKSE